MDALLAPLNRAAAGVGGGGPAAAAVAAAAMDMGFWESKQHLAHARRNAIGQKMSLYFV